MDMMHDIIKKIRPTLNWIKFRKYYDTWLGWIEKQFCNPNTEGIVDCICLKANNLREKSLKFRQKEHCKLKENSCKKYCLQYCDHFVRDNSELGSSSSYNFICPEHESKSEVEEHLLPSHKDIEEYLDKFTSGKMCLM